jgi:hypothetical protein
MTTISNKKHPLKALIVIILTFIVMFAAVFYVNRFLRRKLFIPSARGIVDIDTIQDMRGLGYTGQRKIALDTEGNTFVAYRKNYQNNEEIFVSRIFARGGKVSVSGTDKPIALIGRQDDQRVPSIAVDSKGVIHIVWYGSDDLNTKNNRQIKYANSHDQGQSWSGWRNIAFIPGFAETEDMWQEHPSIFVGKDDTLYVAWEGKDYKNSDQQIKFSVSVNGGNNWSPWKNVNVMPNITQSRPSLVEDNKGKLYLFMYSSGGDSDNIHSIYYAVSENKGATWSEWRMLSDGRFDARHISITADANGKIYAVWRQPVVVSGPSQIILKVYENNRWSDALIVSPSVRFQFFPNIGVDDSGNSYIAWMETEDVSEFPQENPQSGFSFMAYMKNGKFQSPIALGEGSANFYPNVPARVTDINYLPVVYEEQNQADTNTFIIKFKSALSTNIISKTLLKLINRVELLIYK